MSKNERRRITPEIEHVRGDRATKQIVVGTICFSALMVMATLCYRGAFTSDPKAIEVLKDLALMLTGGLLTMLTKTGIEAIADKMTPQTVTTSPGEPLETKEVSDDETSNT